MNSSSPANALHLFQPAQESVCGNKADHAKRIDYSVGMLDVSDSADTDGARSRWRLRLQEEFFAARWTSVTLC
jgi:hypothetical protein